MKPMLKDESCIGGFYHQTWFDDQQEKTRGNF